MKILAIDTSSATCSVAITEDFKKIIELHSSDEKTHSVKLMPLIDKAFKDSNLSLDDINLISCCIGPGSFTGVRIGIATAKAFSDAKNIPVVGVSSLEGLAYNLIIDNRVTYVYSYTHNEFVMFSSSSPLSLDNIVTFSAINSVTYFISSLGLTSLVSNLPFIPIKLPFLQY